MSVGVVKDVHMTQSKHYLRRFVEEDCFWVDTPNWLVGINGFLFFILLRSVVYGKVKTNGQLFCFSWKENGTTSSLSRANDVLGGNGNCGIDVKEQ